MVKDFITTEYPVLKSFDTGEHALTLMEDYKVHHLPLLADGFHFFTLVSEKDLLALVDVSASLARMSWVGNYSIHIDNHLLNALPVMSRYGLSLLPVIDEENIYQGVLTRGRLIDALADACGADVAGSIVVLDLQPAQYSLADIARVVESNRAHILSVMSQPEPRSGHLLVTLKLDTEDASAVIRSFERFDYVVASYFMKDGMIDDIFRRRVNEFIHYMNI